MKKFLKSIAFILATLTLLTFTPNSALASPKTFKLSEELCVFTYEKSTYYIKKLYTDLTDDKVYYCLEITKKYPDMEQFNMEVKHDDMVANLLYYGYPNATPSSLGLKNDDDAYVATQIALWALVENFDITKINTENPSIIAAAKNIYTAAKNGSISGISYELYAPNSDAVQDIVSLQINIPKDDREPNKSELG